MIWLVWAMHHDLFEKAEVITRKTFLVNGIWLFLLTIVPFTTAWVGSAPYSFLPEFLYPLNLLLWSGRFSCWITRSAKTTRKCRRMFPQAGAQDFFCTPSALHA